MAGETQPKKVIMTLILLIVAAVVLAFGLYKGCGGIRKVDNEQQKQVTKIDENTLEVMTMTGREWLTLGQKNGKFKNPKTGEYTMVLPITCGNCGELIPPPKPPKPPEGLDLAGKPASTPEEDSRRKSLMRKMEAEYAKTLREAVCPRCGKPIQ